ncbi:hypothetical protein ES708_33850 [subsurface metagenome]
MPQAILKGQRTFPERKGAVHHSACGIIQNRQQDRPFPFSLLIRDLKGVHEICLHAFQGVLEGKLQLLPLLLAVHTLFSLQTGRQHQPRQRGLGDLGVDHPSIAQLPISSFGSELRVVLQIL